MKCLTIMRKYAILNIHKILQYEQFIKSKDIQQDKHSEKWINLREHQVGSTLSFIGGLYIGARALLDINLVWFGISLACSSWEKGCFAIFYSFKLFLPSTATLWMKQ
jgi:hypothetical protein